MITKNQIKAITALHLKKNRDAANLFIAEGIKTVEEILKTKPEIIEAIYASDVFVHNYSALLLESGASYTLINEADLKRISMQVNPNQVLAICNYFELEPELNMNANLALYLDDLRDPGNMGTILRIADWFGIKTVFCSPESVEIYNNKVIQACMGSFLRVKPIYLPLETVIEQYGFKTVYGAVLNETAIYTVNLKPGLLVIGNEAKGISEAYLKLIHHPLSIPSHPKSGTESLNAAMATGILCSEFFRQLQVVK